MAEKFSKLVVPSSLLFFLILFFSMAPSHLYAASFLEDYQSGVAAMEKGNYPLAKAFFDSAVSQNPNDGKIRKGMFYYDYFPNQKLQELAGKDPDIAARKEEPKPAEVDARAVKDKAEKEAALKEDKKRLEDEEKKAGLAEKEKLRKEREAKEEELKKVKAEMDAMKKEQEKNKQMEELKAKELEKEQELMMS